MRWDLIPPNIQIECWRNGKFAYKIDNFHKPQRKVQCSSIEFKYAAGPHEALQGSLNPDFGVLREHRFTT
jgi:hypothetical protein